MKEKWACCGENCRFPQGQTEKFSHIHYRLINDATMIFQHFRIFSLTIAIKYGILNIHYRN